ncbi:LytR/AlgR family response regulator transcription factor [Oribacterium sp. FC2011]|uniref:LytR/AlgR family response regulator transcription factor n=1 Tax=Oribacterium sp. FC2011 TaxID=1408311 RepID=UPI0004E1E4CF|nr:LytTR family DNA-binding domain-containing protein [Oribacterium sp. FC2011]
MNIAVCDDDINVRKQLADLIRKQYADAKISLFNGSEDLISCGDFFNIYFLDIEMGDVSGIELAKHIRERQEDSVKSICREHEDLGKRSIIIFVTAYREYMEEAFDVNAFHYLVKPIKESKFAEVFQRALKEAQSYDEQRKKYVIIKDGENRKKILFSEIQYIESNDRKVVFHTDGGFAETYARMYDLENELGDTFFRCHRCYLVNFEKVTAYSVNSIQVLNGDSIILAEKKYTDFVKAFLRYAKNGGIVNA